MLEPQEIVVSVRIKSAPSCLCRLKATRDEARGDADRALAHIKRIGPAIPLQSLRQLADVGGTFARRTGRF